MGTPSQLISLRPLLRPGISVSVYRGYTGTLGAFAVSREGDIVMVFAEHQLGEAQFGDPILLEPHGIKVGAVGRARTRLARIIGKTGRPKPRCFRLPRAGETHNVNLRFRNLAEHLPIVLKQPVLPEVGRLCVKSGYATELTYGRIQHLSWSLDVELPDGTFAHFVDQIATEPMAKSGDSGSVLFTADTYEPVGLLSSGNEYGTFYSKLIEIVRIQPLVGIYSPISLPRSSPVELKRIVSCIIPDGFFAQRQSVFKKAPQQILEQLGVRKITRRSDGSFDVSYRDLTQTAVPHLPGDEGSLLSTADHRLIGIAIAGDENKTYAIPASRVFSALDLDLINLSNDSWKMLHGAGYARKFCDTCKLSLYPDANNCPFCGRQLYWGRDRLEHYVKERR